MIGLISSKTPFITEEKRDKIEEDIKRHIELEKQAIETYKKLIDGAENPKIKFILEQIHDDEIRHHELLQKIYKIIVKEETLTDEELWDLMWKDTAFKGTPGG